MPRGMALSSLNSVQTNIAKRMLGMSQKAVAASLEKLATGKRINRAADDPSGVIVVNEMDARRSSIEARIKRAELDGYSHGARDGALGALSDVISELEDKVVLAANRGGMSKGEIDGLQVEVDATLGAIDDLSYTQRFRDQMVLQGFHTATLGYSEGGESHMLSSLLSGGELNLSSGDMELAQKVVRAAKESVVNARAEAGLAMKQSDSEIRSLQEELTNLSDAKSQIEDVDYASEVSTLVRRQVQEAAAQYVLKMTMDMHRQSVMSLLGRPAS